MLKQFNALILIKELHGQVSLFGIERPDVERLVIFVSLRCFGELF